VYTAHRLAHRWAFLWKFHRVHHTLVDMTWSASSRQHPVDFFITVVGANLPAMILGINLKSIALFILFERLYTVMLHADINLDWGWFSKIVASPSLHRLHHSPTVRGKNYAGILSLLDVLGRTYQSPAAVPVIASEATLMAREVREGLVRLRWTPEALDEMLRRGDLDANRHYEILNGELFEKVGPTWPDAFAVNALQFIFGRVNSESFFMASQLPLRIGQDLPEPDLTIIRGSLFGRRETPTASEALLIVEVSDSTYATDFRIKLPIYSTAGVPVYWIVDVNRRRVEVFQRPLGDAYANVDLFEEGMLLPAAFEGCPSIAVSDLFVTEP